MIVLRSLGLIGCLFMPLVAGADTAGDDVAERIAAHFEAASSRLLPEDAAVLDRFVARVKVTPGAKLAVLVPLTRDPVRARFVAARVNELERRVREVAELAEYRRIAANSNVDVLWLALVQSPQRAEGEGPATADMQLSPVESPVAHPPLALTAPASPPVAPVAPVQAVSPADLRLDGWVVKGVRHRAQGPLSAYIARTAPGSTPREIFEHQIDRGLGLVKEIVVSPDSGWVVRTEIGWIGQGSPTSGS